MSWVNRVAAIIGSAEFFAPAILISPLRLIPPLIIVIGIQDISYISYGKGEYYATILYNVKNGDLSPTWFCDMANAPEELKEKYKTFRGEYHPPGYLHNGCFSERQLRALRRLKVTRPFVFEYNGRSVLYCSLATITEAKNSLETSDLNSLDFEDIRKYVDKDNYKHDWEPNDILIWDNLRMQHKREEFKGYRELWRIQLDLQ